MNAAPGLISFLNSTHCSYQTIQNVKNELRDAGFIQLAENQIWKLESSHYYYVTRNDSSLIAFKIPQMNAVRSFNICASHSDSPCLKLKPQPVLADDHYTRLTGQVYGGAIEHTWLDRPLSVAGRSVVRQDGRLVSRLVDFDKDWAIIPSVAIHQQRTINDGHKWNPQTDLPALVALDKSPDCLKDQLAASLLVNKEDIVASDLYLYCRQPAWLWGDRDEFISSPRLDDLANVYGSLQAFKYSYSENAINFYCVFDNEEVGSLSRQGAASNFLSEVINRIYAAFFYTASDANAVMANALLISADNAHGCHPNHPELYDPANAVYLNRGVVIKTSASPAYVTDSVSNALLQQLCRNSQTPYQLYADRSDTPGGSTLAAIMSTHVAARAVDIGLAQLAMHSVCETAGSADIDYLISLLSEFYSSAVINDGDTAAIIK